MNEENFADIELQDKIIESIKDTRYKKYSDGNLSVSTHANEVVLAKSTISSLAHKLSEVNLTKILMTSYCVFRTHMKVSVQQPAAIMLDGRVVGYACIVRNTINAEDHLSCATYTLALRSAYIQDAHINSKAFQERLVSILVDVSNKDIAALESSGIAVQNRSFDFYPALPEQADLFKSLVQATER